MRIATDLPAALARARKVGVPLIAVLTADPAATMPTVLQASGEAFAEDASDAPAVLFDAARGLQGANKLGEEFLKDTALQGALQPTDALCLLHRLPRRSTAFFLGAHRFLDQPDVAQAVWNLRDPFKSNSRALVLLAPYFRLPAELSQDILVLEEPLPGEEELGTIVANTYRDAELPAPDAALTRRCVQACTGLPAFAAEQALALSLRRSQMDLSTLWARKRQAVEQVRGLTFSFGGPGYDSAGGLLHAKQLGAGLFAGPLPPRCIVRIDEIEKQIAGIAGDTSGVAQDFNEVLLRCIQDYNWSGLIAVGPPGSGKSLFSKVLGAQFSVPTLEIDLGACKGGIVGESEANIRALMRVIHALAGDGGAFFIATCNSLTVLPPELRRRFGYGAWMYDLPTAEEREPIWEMHLDRFGLTERDSLWQRPDDTLWTGSDIYTCCELAYRLDCTLQEASEHLMPVAKSAPEPIRALRELADGRFLSASYPGPYRKPDDAITPATLTGRHFEVGGHE